MHLNAEIVICDAVELILCSDKFHPVEWLDFHFAQLNYQLRRLGIVVSFTPLFHEVMVIPLTLRMPVK